MPENDLNTADSAETNPYASPDAPQEKRHRLLRLLIIPATLLSVGAVLCGLFSLLSCLAGAIWIYQTRESEYLDSSRELFVGMALIINGVWGVAASFFGVFAAIAMWNCHWKRFGICIAIFLVGIGLFHGLFALLEWWQLAPSVRRY